MFMRPSFSRRDALLLLLGFSMMHLWSTLSYHQDYSDHERLPANTTLRSKSCSTPLSSPSHANVTANLAHTSIIAHAPGWTIFRDLYMSNGTLFILSSNRSFPEFRLMTSTGLPVQWSPESVAAREPTPNTMDYLTPEEALTRWGGDVERGEKNRVWSVEGNTVSGSLAHSVRLWLTWASFS